jgi:8-oxo-dGTP diphosphatase
MLDELWYLADEASQRAEQAYHRIEERHRDFLEFTHRRSVSRPRFRTLAERVERTGAPYGAHTAVYRDSGELLLVRHEDVDRWVVPGGQQRDGESFREAAERELAEETGIEADYRGLAYLTRMEIRCDDHYLLGVMPVYEARAQTVETEVADPEGEISAARWFDTLPEDTRDRADLLAWRDRTLG